MADGAIDFSGLSRYVRISGNRYRGRVTVTFYRPATANAMIVAVEKQIARDPSIRLTAIPHVRRMMDLFSFLTFHSNNAHAAAMRMRMSSKF